ncbi:MAG: DUF177 domain-containing protein [Candidatus Azobacteroides sp.]|nr:DUF177 domain-containing protein [Candidatus Azobacteroides sp.]
MGKFDPYKVDLKNMSTDVQTIEYRLDNIFFSIIGADEIQKGKLVVHLTVKKISMMYELDFRIDGIVVIPCDRCLDDMDFAVDTNNRLIVKFGKEFAEESDEIIVIPEDEGEINVAWFIYEFIILTIPIKHVHAPGKCNKTMTSKLKKHSAKRAEEGDDFDFVEADEDIITDEEENISMDPRWDALKDLAEDNNN